MKLPWAAVLPAFALGLALGAAGQRAAFHRHMKRAPDPQRMVERLTKRLSLDEGQRGQVLAILETHKPELESLRKEGDEKFGALRAKTNAEIRKTLKPEQTKKFDELVERWEKKHAERRGR